MHVPQMKASPEAICIKTFQRLHLQPYCPLTQPLSHTQCTRAITNIHTQRHTNMQTHAPQTMAHPEAQVQNPTFPFPSFRHSLRPQTKNNSARAHTNILTCTAKEGLPPSNPSRVPISLSSLKKVKRPAQRSYVTTTSSPLQSRHSDALSACQCIGQHVSERKSS